MKANRRDFIKGVGVFATAELVLLQRAAVQPLGNPLFAFALEFLGSLAVVEQFLRETIVTDSLGIVTSLHCLARVGNLALGLAVERGAAETFRRADVLEQLRVRIRRSGRG